MNDAMDRALEMISDQQQAQEQFRIRGGFLIAGLAVVLAIATLLGNNADQDVIQYSILSADTYSFFQAKNVRQTMYKLQQDELKLRLNDPALPAQEKETLQTLADSYGKTVARYDSEPDPTDPTNPIKGEGKKELLARAQFFEAQRDQAMERGNNYDYASVLLQIAIVVASASIIVVSRPLLLVSLALAGIGVMFIVNGLFLIVPLPF